MCHAIILCCTSIKEIRRRIQLDVYSCKNEPFVILDAVYEITGIEGEIIASRAVLSVIKCCHLCMTQKEKGSFE